MVTELTTQQFVEILGDPEITRDIDIALFRAIYSFPDHQAPASKAGRLLGYTGKNPAASLNSESGRYAKRIAKKYDVEFELRPDQTKRYWRLFFDYDGPDEDRLEPWILKPNLVKALQESNLTGDIEEPNEIPAPEAEKLPDGAKCSITVNVYERNPQAKKRCIKKYGATYTICGIDFGKEYGAIGEGFIHVHHLKPLNEIKEGYEVDPINDLVPICPNCHAMIHRVIPKSGYASAIEELQHLYSAAQSQKRAEE